jgi:hypothetical protein
VELEFRDLEGLGFELRASCLQSNKKLSGDEKFTFNSTKRLKYLVINKLGK